MYVVYPRPLWSIQFSAIISIKCLGWTASRQQPRPILLYYQRAHRGVRMRYRCWACNDFDTHIHTRSQEHITVKCCTKKRKKAQTYRQRHMLVTTNWFAGHAERRFKQKQKFCRCNSKEEQTCGVRLFGQKVSVRSFCMQNSLLQPLQSSGR